MLIFPPRTPFPALETASGWQPGLCSRVTLPISVGAGGCLLPPVSQAPGFIPTDAMPTSP